MLVANLLFERTDDVDVLIQNEFEKHGAMHVFEHGSFAVANRDFRGLFDLVQVVDSL